MENTKVLYDNTQFESAIEMYNSIKPDIINLITSVEEKNNQLKESKMKSVRLVIIFVAVIVVVIVGYILYKKVKESGEYSWLYKKWKRKH
jgi:F0F1-type ATP synthase assembly protein I